MFLWPWSNNLLILLRVFMLIAMKRILEQGTRSVVGLSKLVLI